MHATLIYDGDCPMCRQSVAWIRARTADAGLEPLPCQSPERRRRFPKISDDQCMKAMQLVLDDGTVYSGATALPLILEHVRGWRWLAWTLRLPGIAWLSPLVYAFIARNRLTISRLVREKPPGQACGKDACPTDPEAQ